MENVSSLFSNGAVYGWMIGILAVLMFITFIAIVKRYKKCPSNKVLVVYGKTRGKKSAKMYHGGAAFIWPIIQSFEFLDLEPMNVKCDLADVLSGQMIRVSVPINLTVGISTDETIMQNAAERLLGMKQPDIEKLIKEVSHGQMRLVIASMQIEDMNSDRDKFLSEVKTKVDLELNKLGLSLININMSDIQDNAEYLLNLSREAESKARNEALASIEEQNKIGAIKIAAQVREKEIKTSEQNKDKEIQVAEIKKEEATKVSEADKLKAIAVAENKSIEDSKVAAAEAQAVENVTQANTERDSKVAEYNAQLQKRQAKANQDGQLAENLAQEEIAKSGAKLNVTKAEAKQKSGEAFEIAEAGIKQKKEEAAKAVEEARARKVEAQLQADNIVPAEQAKKEKVIQAAAIGDAAKTQAEGEGEAELIRAKKAAEALRLKGQAEGDAKKAVLLAEAEGVKAKALAEAEGFSAMMEAAQQNSEIAVQYKMIEQWKEIAGEQVKAFENIKLGEITVFDGGNATGNFLNNIVKTVAPALNIMDQLPIGETFKGILKPGTKTEVKKD